MACSATPGPASILLLFLGKVQLCQKGRGLELAGLDSESTWWSAGTRQHPGHVFRHLGARVQHVRAVLLPVVRARSVLDVFSAGWRLPGSVQPTPGLEFTWLPATLGSTKDRTSTLPVVLHRSGVCRTAFVNDLILRLDLTRSVQHSRRCMKRSYFFFKKCQTRSLVSILLPTTPVISVLVYIKIFKCTER